MRESFSRILGEAVGLVAISVAAQAGGPLADGDFDTSFQGDGRFAYHTPSEGGRAAAVALDGRLLVGYTAILAGTDRDMRLLPVPDQGITTHCGSYHPDLGDTDEDVLNDIAAFGNLILLAGRAAGPPEDTQAQAAVGAVNLPTCTVTAFGGPDGALTSTSSPVEAEAIVATPQGGARVAALHGAGNDRQLLSYGLDSAGTLDAGFDSEFVDFTSAFGALYFEPHDMVRQPDGRLVVAGTVGYADGDRDVGVVRFTSAGVPDAQFSLDGLVSFSYDIIDVGDDEGNAIALMNDGRIVVGGSDASGGETYAAVAVLTSTGGFFNDFGIVGRCRFSYDTGIFRADSVRAIATQGDGRIVVVGGAGLSLSSSWGVARLLATGDAPLDPSFNGDGRRTVPWSEGGTNNGGAYDVTLGQGGLISIVGSATTDAALAVAAARLWNSYIFADGFESGSRYYWEAVQP